MVDSQGFFDQDKLWENDIQKDSGSYDIHKQNLVNKLQTLKKTCIFGLIGGFGTGKSTMLNDISKGFVSDNVKWINFDAWEIPDRKNLWDGLVLQIVKNYDISIKDIKKQIYGSVYSFRNWIIYSGIIIGLILIGILSYFNDYFKGNSNLILISTISLVILQAIFGILPYLSSFEKNDPITRINEFKDLLNDALKKNKFYKIYIVLEDIDRVGTEGIYFLETLKNFLEKSLSDDIKTKLIFVVPISSDGDNGLENKFQSYIKCFDFYEDYVTAFNWNSFFDEVLFEDYKDTEFIKFLGNICSELIKTHSIREIKFILRTINNKFINNPYKSKINRQLYLLVGIMCYMKEGADGKYSKIIKFKYKEEIRCNLSDGEINKHLYTFITKRYNIQFNQSNSGIRGNVLLKFIRSITDLGNVEYTGTYKELATINVPSFYKD